MPKTLIEDRIELVTIYDTTGRIQSVKANGHDIPFTLRGATIVLERDLREFLPTGDNKQGT